MCLGEKEKIWDERTLLSVKLETEVYISFITKKQNITVEEREERFFSNCLCTRSDPSH